MGKAIALVLVTALLIGSGLSVAQEKGGGQAPQQPMMGPGMMGQGMMCPCMMMMQRMSQASPEEMKKMQEEMRQWMQACPMMKMQQPQPQQEQPQKQQKK